MASSTRGRRERQLGESNAGRVAHRVRDRGERRDDRDLADAADPVRCSGFATSTITVSIIGRSDATGMR
jgi:hypothetical protein